MVFILHIKPDNVSRIMKSSIFTRIIQGEIPCQKIYEDSKTMAFLDINPSQPGHTLVVTKLQVDQYIDLPNEDYIALWQTVKKVATRLKQVLGTDRVKIMVVGTDVPHVHVHLIPFNEKDDVKTSINNKPDTKELEQMATKLRFED